jgi:hypothetical protein
MKNFELSLHHNCTFQLQFYTLRDLQLVQFKSFTQMDVKFHTLLPSTLHGEGFQLHSTAKVKVKVTLRLAVYRQSVRLGARPLETHDQRSFPSELLR